MQGVFFRDSTRRRAHDLGLTGWVRNMPGGRVEALAEGDEAAVRALVEWLHRGPELAHVTDVEVDWGPASGEFLDFSVRF